MDSKMLRSTILPGTAFDCERKRKRDSCINCDISNGKITKAMKDLADHKYYRLDLCSNCESKPPSRYFAPEKKFPKKKNFKVIELSYAREQREFLEKYFFKYGVKEREIRRYCYERRYFHNYKEFISDIDDDLRPLRYGFDLGINPKPEEYAKYFFKKYPKASAHYRIARFRVWIREQSQVLSILESDSSDSSDSTDSSDSSDEENLVYQPRIKEEVTTDSSDAENLVYQPRIKEEVTTDPSDAENLVHQPRIKEEVTTDPSDAENLVHQPKIKEEVRSL